MVIGHAALHRSLVTLNSPWGVRVCTRGTKAPILCRCLGDVSSFHRAHSTRGSFLITECSYLTTSRCPRQTGHYTMNSSAICASLLHVERLCLSNALRHTARARQPLWTRAPLKCNAPLLSRPVGECHHALR